MKNVKNKPAAKKTVAKKTTKKATTKNVTKAKSEKITFNKYSLYFQALSVLLLIAAFTLNICCCIGTGLMLDLFALSVIFLAFSLFPKGSLK